MEKISQNNAVQIYGGNAMKKSNFAALILGTIGVVFFALGMCMCTIEEWAMFRQGIIAGAIGLVVLLIPLTKGLHA